MRVLPPPRSTPLPRYFFHVFDGGTFHDDHGQELPDDEAVRREAMTALPEIARHGIPQDGDKQGYTVLAVDEAGAPVYTATLSYAGVWLRRDV